MSGPYPGAAGDVFVSLVVVGLVCIEMIRSEHVCFKLADSDLQFFLI